ncbi:SRPBCC family protein [Curtobacterium sp. MCPF17_002]|uniref:SRPBCC family protein n=1 Tax=Curtobacterium sp. MCPF17_002 TaxID=2175645 RepID=UPI000DAAA93E|nr:SRPBCC family protein [Curtobacterium sp. MCPF17_002]WIB76905.1 SRPBCC family protein [Curtobacterium sp. MCPF17_002]
MPTTSVHTDPEELTMTLVAEFPVPVERLWGAFADPRQLERFWGPPGFPATFTSFDLRPGGRAHYRMTSPQGELFRSLWQVSEVDEPNRIVFRDLFATEDGEVDGSMPGSETVLTFEPVGARSRVTVLTSFTSSADLDQMLAMGMLEGYTQAFGQLDRVLADLREYALGKGTVTDLVDDTHVRITRAFEAPRHLLWRAHTDPELMRRWLLGPDGWEMTVCENDLVVGGTYRNAWAPTGDTAGEPFGFDGENLVIEPERRIVTTERMTGAPFPANVNDLQFDEVDGVTLMTLLITYPDQAQRDMVLATGMTDGMEASYQRLEGEVLTAAA